MLNRFACGEVCHLDFSTLNGFPSSAADHAFDADVCLEHTTEPLHLFDKVLPGLISHRGRAHLLQS